MHNEPPFSIRKEVEHFHNQDEATEDLISRYEDPPLEVRHERGERPGVPAIGASGVPQARFMQGMLNQMQQHLDQVRRDQDLIRKELETSSLGDTDGGFAIKMGPEVLKWLLVLFAIVVLVWVITRKNKKNPLKKRLGRVEKQLKRLRRSRRRRNPSLPIYDLDEDEDDEEGDGIAGDDLDLDDLEF